MSKRRSGRLGRATVGLAVVGGMAAAVAVQLPELRRYMKIRSM